MDGKQDTNSQVEHWLDRHREGEPTAREELIRVALRRLDFMARKMFESFPSLQRWEQPDDVLTAALARLHRALATIQPDSPAGFFALAGKQIRWQLLDFKKTYSGAEGLGARYKTDPPEEGGGPNGPHLEGALASEPGLSAELSELYLQWIEELPERQREVINLLITFNKSEEEVEKLLGVTDHTVRELKKKARLRLIDALQK